MVVPLHVSDKIKQGLFPTIMVPQKSELPACKEGQTRLLMANDGLYLETRQPWGGLVKQLWDCQRHPLLPYGRVQEEDYFHAVLHAEILPIIEEVMIPEAARFAEEGKEWGGFIVWNGSEFVPWIEDFTATKNHVRYNSHGAAALPEGMSLVADIHSHGTMEPFFSPWDNESDTWKVKISVVLGSYKRIDNRPKFQWRARYCVEGFFF
jgi:PRTRC genetic system protein A